jgi:hypothetical protein
MPDGAECRTAPDAEGREMPTGAPTTQRANGAVAHRRWRALWHLALSGIWRASAFGAVWHFALLLLCAIRHFALFGRSRSFGLTNWLAP